jgi:hypothetical protein
LRIIILSDATDLRNVMTTIINIPEDYRGTCAVVINQPDIDLFTRNLLILLLTLCIGGPQHEEKALSNMRLALHLWYSASLTRDQHEEMKNIIHYHLTPFFDDLRKPCTGHSFFKFHGHQASMLLTLGKSDVEHIIAVVDEKPLPFNVANIKRANVSKKFRLEKDQMLLACPPAHRIVEEEYSRTGVLLPLGSNSDDFTIPNPYVDALSL